MLHPPGRIGTSEFLSIVGLSRSTFYRHFRYDPLAIELFDMRVREGVLSFSLEATQQYAASRIGQIAGEERSSRAASLLRTHGSGG